MGCALAVLVPAGGCIGASNGSTSTSSGSNNVTQTADANVVQSGDAVVGLSDTDRQYPLSSLGQTAVTIGENTFRVWLAQEFDTSRPGVIAEGLMHVRPEEIAADQGMLFVFSDEQVRGFWMLNTTTPLDIAFARSNGEIVRITQMAPHTLRTHSSIEPAMLALEVAQGTFARLGIKEGDRLDYPLTVFSVQP